ncbi:MAG: alpha-amylase family glycosyl hydrolase [Balneolaceae bacterium]
MDSPYSSVQFGCILTPESTVFRLFFPEAGSVECLIFSSYEEESPVSFPMIPSADDIWELTVDRNLSGSWYQYRAEYKKDKMPAAPNAHEPFADPCSRHVTVRNNHRQEAKTLIFEDRYDWKDDTFITVPDPRDLIIYETHIKDLVAHPSSGATGRSIYKKWMDPDQAGGIPYLKKLGVNAVEFLPLQKFPPFEPPFGKTTQEGYRNTWNTYSRNHWGYMTSFFFAPETAYASGGGLEKGAVTGRSIAAVTELKDIVRELHRNDIAVIMDVVYNHTSLFDVNPLCHHMPDTFLRKTKEGQLMNRSGTGNEIRTEHPAVIKLITDSIKHWMNEYHIDGFRFDLAGLIDEKSWDKIRDSVLSVNPDALLIAEPWGGRYVPALFSNHEWASWNDRFRNGIKGSSPHDDRGFIFSGWHHGSNRKHLENWFTGTHRDLEGGLFRSNLHCVNYLESHDGYTLGDYIRICSRYNGENPVIQDRDRHMKLTAGELRTAMLGAFCLMVTPGIAMIHAGQEFARSKLIVDAGDADSETGRMDYNSYNKDNETNWINFDDLSENTRLYSYYRGLIDIRKESPALRKSGWPDIRFDYFTDPLHVCYTVCGLDSGDIYDYYIAINAVQDRSMEFHAPEGLWEVLVNNGIASASPIEFLTGSMGLPAGGSALLRRLRH